MIPAVARLHLAALPGTLSNLGQAVIREYYQAALGCPWLIAQLAVREQQVLGMVVGSTEPPRVWRDVLARGGFKLGTALAGALLRNPSALAQLLASTRAEPCRTTRSVELIYLAVDAAARGQNIGDALMRAFAAETEKRGKSGYYLFVHKENVAAQRLYAKHGLRVVQAFALNGVDYFCMESEE